MIKQISIFAGAIALACALSVAAQPYPSKPLRLIVPYPPGGTGDALCREIAARMASTFGQQILVDNRAGANGMIGADVLAKAQPDGYTIGLMTSSHSAMPHVSKLPFDPVHSFVPRWTRTAGSSVSWD